MNLITIFSILIIIRERVNKNVVYELLFVFTILLSGCDNIADKTAPRPSSPSSLQVDYKQNTYGLFLGQLKDSVDKKLELQTNFEADRQTDRADSIKHYMNIGEDLIKIVATDTTEILPAVYFTFSKNKLSNFGCYLIYEPDVKNATAIHNFVSQLQPYFNKLSMNDNVNKLSQALGLNFSNDSVEEKFVVDTSDQYTISFNYSIKAKR